MKSNEKSNLLITGASSGVGAMLVRELKSEFNIVTISRRTTNLLNQYDGLKSYSCDISDRAALKETLNKIDLEVGHCPYIINCAGYMETGNLDTNKINSLPYSVEVNAIAPMIIINHFIERMKELNFGRVINLTSGAPLNCYPGFGLYSSSKAILNSLTTTLSREVSSFNNISINLMSPGPVKSEMSPNASLLPEVCLPTIRYLLEGKGRSQHEFFFWLGYKVPLFPNLEGVDWLNGKGNNKLEKIEL